MPGMPVFQEFPNQLKGQIFVEDSTNNEIVALKVDHTGHIPVNGTVGLASGTEVGLAAGTEVDLAAGAEVALAAGTTVGLAAGTDIDNVASVTTLGTVTNDVKVVNGATALTVGLAAGTEVDLAAGAEVALAAGTTVGLAAGTDIDNVASVTTLGTVTNDVKVVNGATALTVGLAAGTEVDLAAGAEVALAAGTTVGLAAGTDIDNVASVTTLGTVTNDVKVVNGATALTVGLAAGTEVDLAAGAEVALAAGTTVGLAAGTDIDNVASVTTLGTVTNDVKVVNGATALTVGLAAGTEVDLAAGAEVALAAGTEVGLAAGTNIIGRVENQLVFTNVDAFGAGTPLTPKAIGLGATVYADAQDISLQSSYNWFIQNQGSGLTQGITLLVQISPNGTDWLNDTGVAIALPSNESKIITVTHFLQYVRFVITGGLSGTTVIACFQAQH